MKKIFLLIPILIAAISCQKKDNTTSDSTPSKIDSTAIIDSLNRARTKINDSIRSKNRFPSLSGTHTISHDLIGKGNVKFTKVGGNGDEYLVDGGTKSGKNYLTINGTSSRVSEKHFNFTGKIIQSIQDNDNGKVYTRNATKTFMTKDGGKTWRLQEKDPNPSGFVDIIEIKF